MSTNDFGAGYEELRRIFEKSLHGILDWINRDAKAVAKASDWKQADDHFWGSFLGLWFMFENKIWSGTEGKYKNLVKWVTDSDLSSLFEKRPPFLAVLERALGDGNLPRRPTISGFLTELYVYFYLEWLLKKNANMKVAFGSNKVRISKPRYTPDVAVYVDEEPRFVVEVKTALSGKAVAKNLKTIRQKYEGFGDTAVEFLLFCGDARRGLQCLRNEDWVCFPGAGRLQHIVRKIRTGRPDS